MKGLTKMLASGVIGLSALAGCSDSNNYKQVSAMDATNNPASYAGKAIEVEGIPVSSEYQYVDHWSSGNRAQMAVIIVYEGKDLFCYAHGERADSYLKAHALIKAELNTKSGKTIKVRGKMNKEGDILGLDSVTIGGRDIELK